MAKSFRAKFTIPTKKRIAEDKVEERKKNNRKLKVKRVELEETVMNSQGSDQKQRGTEKNVRKKKKETAAKTVQFLNTQAVSCSLEVITRPGEVNFCQWDTSNSLVVQSSRIL